MCTCPCHPSTNRCYHVAMPALPEPLVLTREQVRQVDRIAIEQFHVPGIVLMENAARGVIRAIFDEQLPQQNVVIFCGGGNNGGDGLAIARHLHNAGVGVRVMLTVDPATYRGDALINWRIVEAMKLPVEQAVPDVIKKVSNALIIDAIFGTGLTQRPRDPFPSIVAAVKTSGCPVLA